MSDAPHTDDVYLEFLKEHCAEFRLLPPLFKALKRKFPKRRWPQKDPRKAFQCLDLLLDTIGDGEAHQVLRDYLAASHRQDMKKAAAVKEQKRRLATRRKRTAPIR